jgi:hypothetical protein
LPVTNGEMEEPRDQTWPFELISQMGTRPPRMTACAKPYHALTGAGRAKSICGPKMLLSLRYKSARQRLLFVIREAPTLKPAPGQNWDNEPLRSWRSGRATKSANGALLTLSRPHLSSSASIPYAAFLWALHVRQAPSPLKDQASPASAAKKSAKPAKSAISVSRVGVGAHRFGSCSMPTKSRSL